MYTKTKGGTPNKGNYYFLRVPLNKGDLMNTGTCLFLEGALNSYR